MRETAPEEPWAGKLADITGSRSLRHSAEWQYYWLRPLCSHIDIWRTTYFHVLKGGAPAIPGMV